MDDRRQLPAVGSLLEDPLVEELIAQTSRQWVVDEAREVLAERRAGAAKDGRTGLVDELRRRVAPSLRRVVNATGVILHTNLGRAPLARQAIDGVLAAAGSCSLEWDPTSGARGSRQEHVKAHLRATTGAEDACVTNSNAAALILALAALGRGEVVISRGQLVEIGGGFRIPEVLEAAGARTVEVGTTNRTRASDYERAITEETVAILRVHPSNFRTVGFVEEAPLKELARISSATGVALVDDLGSGVLRAHAALAGEPDAATSIADGADLVCFSADKLLGGPQAGVIVGTSTLVARCAQHPLMRAVRPDKLTLAALEATLSLHRDEAQAWREIPVLAMLARPVVERRGLAEALARQLGGEEVLRTVGRVGGGTMPLTEIESYGVTVSAGDDTPDALARRLRQGDPPVAPRIMDQRVVLDVLALSDADLADIPEAVARAGPA